MRAFEIPEPADAAEFTVVSTSEIEAAYRTRLKELAAGKTEASTIRIVVRKQNRLLFRNIVEMEFPQLRVIGGRMRQNEEEIFVSRLPKYASLEQLTDELKSIK